MKTLRLLIVGLAGGAGLLTSAARAADSGSKLLPLYEKVSTFLAADNLTDARSAACVLAAEAAQLKAASVAETATKVGKAATLADARETFKNLSQEVIPLARKQSGWFIFNCPMSNAPWVQRSRTGANPYLGKDMSTCGTVTEVTKG